MVDIHPQTQIDNDTRWNGDEFTSDRAGPAVQYKLVQGKDGSYSVGEYVDGKPAGGTDGGMTREEAQQYVQDIDDHRVVDSTEAGKANSAISRSGLTDVTLPKESPEGDGAPSAAPAARNNLPRAASPGGGRAKLRAITTNTAGPANDDPNRMPDGLTDREKLTWQANQNPDGYAWTTDDKGARVPLMQKGKDSSLSLTPVTYNSDGAERTHPDRTVSGVGTGNITITRRPDGPRPV